MSSSASTKDVDRSRNLPLTSEEYKIAPDRLKKAQDRLEEDPFDTESWSAFIRENQRRKCVDARPFYEKLVLQFPTCSKYWRLYIEHEIRAHNYEKVEKLFQRCLIKILNIDLWRCYLSYIKETKASLPTFKEKMAQAYDFAIEKIGHDHSALPIWMDYITFLKSVEAVGSYAENQRITAVRRVYQRGTVTPMQGVEQLWKDYCIYENSINPIIAKKMIEERSKDYSNAKRVAREYDMQSRGINRSLPSVPPQNTADELKQLELWKKLIDWEKTNPLRSEDQTAVTKRVMFAFEQCLLCLSYHPDIWYEATSYLEQASRLLSEKGDLNTSKVYAEDAASMYDRATTGPLKDCLLLYLSYADYEEARLKYDKSHTVYKRFLEIEKNDPTLCYIQYMHFCRRAEGIKSARGVFKLAREDKRSTYHVFVAAALMEFYCSKDKGVAYKIFELGLKRYGDVTDFVLAFIDFMMQLNEDNNTRVLFERVLTSSQLPVDKSVDIWRRFVEFESQIGDLPSITKVEKRRLAVHQGLKDHGSREAALLVERYKFLDLLPGSLSELRCLGYKETSRSGGLTLVKSAALPAAENHLLEEDGDSRVTELPRPDPNQMIPFKPRQVVPTGAHPVNGGIFPPPPPASHLLTLLPPPQCFIGPFVKIDNFLEHFKRITLPDELVLEESGGGGGDVNGHTEPVDAGTAFSINQANILSKKRKALVPGPEDGDSDGEGDNKAPSRDIYRARQQKRVR